MSQEVIMPQMGESIAEGTVTTWLKKVGDKVERDEPLFEISTDKVDAEIPSPTAGVLLEIKVSPGETVPINTVVAIIGEAGEAPAKEAPQKAVSAPVEKKAEAPAKAAPQEPAEEKSHAAPAPAPGSNEREASDLEERRRTKSSPVVRKIAAEHGVDITSVPGTGISGRVTKQDILSHIESGGPTPAAAASAAVAPAAAPAAARAGGAAAMGVSADVLAAYRARVFEGDRVEEMSTMRAKIAEHMVASKHISPHVATVFDIDYSRVDELRRKYKGAWKERHGVNLTFTAFIMRAVVDALKRFPVVNASVDGSKVIYHKHVNLGLAVALDWGLIVPVVHAADELNLLGLARRAADLAERARGKKLKPDEVQSGTFTITNPGIYGPLFGLPVINQPQVAILGVGGIEKRPVVINDMIGIRTKGYLSMSFDHRIVDGAVADSFMSAVKETLQNFDEAQL